MNRTNIRTADPTSGQWRRLRTHMTTSDDALVMTWGVQVSATGQWIGRLHPIGPEPEQMAEAQANAGLFATSKDMSELLIEATRAWSDQLDGPDDHDQSVSGADLLEWFARWRLRARATLDGAGVP